jgi:hypothetical protein
MESDILVMENEVSGRVAIRCIAWLDHWAMIMCLSRPANPPDDKSASDQAKNEVKEQEPDIHIEEKGESRSSK